MVLPVLSLPDQTQLFNRVIADSQTGVVNLEAIRDEDGQWIDFLFTLVNPAAAAILGQSVEQLIGKRFCEHFTAAGREPLLNHYRHVLESGKPLRLPDVSYHADGVNGWFDLRAVKHNDGIIITFADITHVKQAVLEAEEQTRFLDSILNVSQEAVYVLEAVREPVAGQPNGSIVDFRYRQVNAAFERLFNVGAHQLIGQLYLTLYPTVKTSGLFDQFCAVVETGQLLHQELFYEGEGLNGWYELTVVKLNDGLVGTTRDVTQSKQAAQQAQQQLLSLVNNSADFMAIATLDGSLTYINQAGRVLAGVGPDQDVTKLHVKDFYQPEGYQKLIDVILPVVWQQGSWSGDIDIRHFGTQELIPCQANFIRIFDPLTGQPMARGVTLRDLRQERAARQSLLESEERLKEAIDLAELGTWSLDLRARRVTFSDRLAGWFGLAASAITPEAVSNAVHPNDRFRVEQAVRWALQPESGGRYSAEYTIVNQQTGQQTMVLSQGQTYFDQQRKPYLLTGTTQDVTIQRMTQQELSRQVQDRTQELRKANDDLRQSNESLQEFAYVASHDLQEPLRKIESFGNLLHTQYADSLDEPGRDILSRMQTAALRMSALIKDLLNYSRITAGHQPFQAVSLTNLTHRVLDDLAVAVAETRADVRVGELPVVLGDELQLRQMFQNLLSNALKFRQPTVPPRISISADQISARDLPDSARPSVQADLYDRISVRDNGIGFDEKYLDRMFQVFQRLHGKSQYTGTGIGLAIVQKVVLSHGGTITASSQPGQGAQFDLYLPVVQL